jgi:hypothetical protein
VDVVEATATGSDVVEQLLADAQARLEASEPDEWGEELDVVEHEQFLGRYLGEEVSPDTNRPVILLLAPAAGVSDLAQSTIPVFIRVRAMLRSELDRVRPNGGDFIVIARGEDRQGKENAYHTYAVACAPCSAPVPKPAVATAAGSGGSEASIPFSATA